jgi:hypothetical protein
MLYTVMPPALRRDRIILYPGQMAARAPAEGHADGTITAKGPIPERFFAECPPHPATPPGAASP